MGEGGGGGRASGKVKAQPVVSMNSCKGGVGVEGGVTGGQRFLNLAIPHLGSQHRFDAHLSPLGRKHPPCSSTPLTSGTSLLSASWPNRAAPHA